MNRLNFYKIQEQIEQGLLSNEEIQALQENTDFQKYYQEHQFLQKVADVQELDQFRGEISSFLKDKRPTTPQKWRIPSWIFGSLLILGIGGFFIWGEFSGAPESVDGDTSVEAEVNPEIAENETTSLEVIGETGNGKSLNFTKTLPILPTKNKTTPSIKVVIKTNALPESIYFFEGNTLRIFVEKNQPFAQEKLYLKQLDNQLYLQSNTQYYQIQQTESETQLREETNEVILTQLQKISEHQ